MTLEEYREEFLSQLRNNAQINGNLNQEQFIEEALDLLVKNEVLIDPVMFRCNLKKKKRHCQYLRLLRKSRIHLLIETRHRRWLPCSVSC